MSSKESMTQTGAETAHPQGADRLFAEGLGNAWLALTGRDPARVLPEIIGTVLHAGGTRPPWRWIRAGKEYVLMAWPQDQPVRAGVIMAGDEGGQLRPETAVPLIEGLPNDLTVEATHPRKEGLGAEVAVEMVSGKNPMWFFDPLYGRDRDDLTPGVTHTFWLGAIAFTARKALLDNITLTSGPDFERHARAWLEENPGKSHRDVPPLKVDIRDKRIIMPGHFYGEYHLRAVIDETVECQFDKMPIKILYLKFPFDNRDDMRLPLFASAFVLRDFVPEKGQEVEAYAWLQGRIIDLEAPDKATESNAE